MTLSTDELDWLMRRLCPEADAAALSRIEAKVTALGLTVGEMTLDLNALGETMAALRADAQKETEQMAVIDDKLTTVENAVAQVGNDVKAEIDRLTALANANVPITPQELARLDGIATSLQNVDATAVAAGQPIAAPAPAGGDTTGDTTGGTTDPTGGTTVSGGTTDQTPVPVDAAPAPDTGTGTDGSATGPAA